MDLNNKNKKIIFFLVLVILVSCLLLGIIILKKVQMDLELNAKLEQSILESGWPKEVPMIKNEYINISKQSEGSWYITVNKPISYDDFRNYLLELYDEGFKPISDTGSKNPKLLSLEEPKEDGFILFWAGMNSNYTVETFWQKEEIKNVSGEIIDNDFVTIILYSNLDNENDFDDVEDGNISGDSINFSGDNVITSGEDVLEDRNEGEEG